MFVESESNPKKDSLLVWFNGGPGCSSMAGFIKGHGPFVIEDESKNITRNPHPWNKNSNVLYIESPAGVGFSTLTGKEDRDSVKYNDELVTKDALKALTIWYERFPKFGWKEQNNTLYITGESYGGIYVPYLSYYIHLNNMKADAKNELMKFNLKGFVVANGVSDWKIDTYPSMIDNWYRFNVIPTNLHTKFIKNKCFFTFHNVLPFKAKDKNLCIKLIRKIFKSTRKLNIYDILRKNYNIKPDKSAFKEAKYGTALINGEKVSYKRSFSIQEYAPWTK